MKRIFDIFASLGLILVFAPAYLVVGLLVWIKLGWPVLFRQVRPGLHGEPFGFLKFRSMKPDRPELGAEANSDAARLTLFGSWLRSTSLDELPQLFNVLIGDMSLVGPRPLLMHYLPRYSKEQARRHDVLPGITGWAQVNGRNALSWDDKFKLDVWYVDHRSFCLDLKILALTVKKVFVREGISSQGTATAAEFMGSSSKDRK